MNLHNLLFNVSLIDRMSGPARGMMHTLDTVTTRIQGGFNKIGYGAAGLVGAGYALDRIIQPAKEMAAALGEVSSLDVGQQVLADLNSTALKYSIQYGESAADFVRSSYDIQSAISGLSGNELPAFTNASAILAKGTKADTATITSYVGTMYGIFQKNADTMGKADWVNQLAGQTAMAVKIFKTTGQGMSESFTTIGAAGQTMGVAMSEQIGILGTLQATMSGSEAGTKYRAFLKGVGHAQKELGLQFTDSQGKMLPMAGILDKINGKFGKIDTVAKSDLIQKAFGSDEAAALVKLLSTNVDGLSDSIAKIGAQTGIQKAIDMANAMTQPWDRASSAVDALMIILGQTMLPLLTPIFNGISNISGTLMRWAELFPNLTRWIGYAVLGIIGIIAALSALSIVVGLGMVVMAGFGLVMAVITSPITFAVLGVVALGVAISASIYKWDEWGGAIMYVGRAITDALGITGILEVFWTWLTAIYKGWSLIFSVIYDNAGGILSFIGDVVMAVGKIVDILGRAMGFGAVLDWVEKLFSLIVNGWKLIAGMVLPDWMKSLIPGMSATVNVAQPIPGTTTPAAVAQPIPGTATPQPQAVAPQVSGTTPMPQAVAPQISGATPAATPLPQAVAPRIPAATPLPQAVAHQISGTTPTAHPGPVMFTLPEPPKPIAAPKAISQSQTANTPRGGIMSQINNANKQIDVGGIYITNPSAPVNGQTLADQLALAAG